MITHELISSEWEKDYPSYQYVKKNLENLPEITLNFENTFNKYWDFYYKAERQAQLAKTRHRKIEAVLKRYYSKKPLTEEEVNDFNLDPLNISFTKQEVDMMVKSHDKYGESEMTIKSAESLVERIKECIDFVRKWSYNQKDFIGLYRLINGYAKE